MPADRITGRSPSVGIIGAGPGGLALGIFLRKAGFRDFVIFDREDGVGGTWRINTYPGLACDVKSHLYSYSFDLNPDWSRLWSGQREILDYFEDCARRYDLEPNLRLNTEIRSAEWNAESNAWHLTTASGELHSFDVVVSAVGLFTRPVMPNLAEEEPFTGTLMHSARWDHAVDLTNSRVAVLGTGSNPSQLLTEDGTELEVDVVVCATGYAAADYLGQIDVMGEGGVSLRETWRDGAYAYLGMTVPGVPNFFMLYGPNTNVGSNSVIFMLEAQAHYIVRALTYMRRKRKSYVALRPETMTAFIAKIDQWMEGIVWTTRCSNYFRAANGRVVTQWPRSARSFWSMTRRFRAADYVFDPPYGPTADRARDHAAATR